MAPYDALHASTGAESEQRDDAGSEGLAPDALAAVVNGAVAKIVVKQAVAEFPDGVAFRQRLLETLRDYSFPGVQEIAREIYDGVEVRTASSDTSNIVSVVVNPKRSTQPQSTAAG